MTEDPVNTRYHSRIDCVEVMQRYSSFIHPGSESKFASNATVFGVGGKWPWGCEHTPASCFYFSLREKANDSFFLKSH